MNALLEQFLAEARENLKFIEQNLEFLENGDDELLNSVFRAAHTMKGGSGIVGFESLKSITHKAEDLLDMLRAGKIEFEPKILEVLYDVFDEALNLVEAAEESGDIVEANQAVQQSLIERLNEVMGKSDEKPDFTLPFTLLQTPSLIVGQTLQIQRDGSFAIPLLSLPINEENLQNERLWGVYFDLTSDCMQFGNDPVYAMSLLGEKLICVSSCIDEESAKISLAAADDDESMLLRMRLCCLVYGRFCDIEDALYNFMDDLLLLPLDISTLLSVSRGERSDVPLLIDTAKEAKSAAASKDRVSLAKILERSLELLNKKHLSARMLFRFLTLLPYIDDDSLVCLLPFFDAAASATPFVYDPLLQPAKTVVSDSSEAVEFGEKEREEATQMLNQQLERLKSESAQLFLPSIAKVTRQCAAALGQNSNIADGDAVSLIEAVNYLLGKESTQPQKEQSAVALTQSAPSEPTKRVTEERAESKKEVIGKVVKVEQESIDTLMSVVGELLVAKNSLPYLAESVVGMEDEAIKRAVMEKYSHIDRLTDQLQDLIMSMRMLPISYVFDRYPKLVREIGKNLDKKVKLIQDGGDTKLDKNMIEMLADPLIHIVRNSLDHGIERPQDRVACGKDDTGTLKMNAYPQSDKVIIEIEDDGKGIDPGMVANKVIEKGLLPIEKIEAMSDQEKVELIMLPGLSTAESISEYSGRGVGMDVVRKSIQNFGGTIQIQSRLGKGTKIVLSIPVSLALTTLLHIMMGKNHYGIPMDYVSETVKIEKDQITYLNNGPYIYIRDQIIPLFFIRGILDKEMLHGKPLSIVVLNIKGNQLAVAVNELIGQLDVVQKPLEGLLAKHPLISGTALLGNGQIIMIFDPIGLVEMNAQLKETL